MTVDFDRRGEHAAHPPMPTPDTLVILPNLPGLRKPDGTIVLTKKLIDGAHSMAAAWRGPVHMIVEPWDTFSDNLDNVAVPPDDGAVRVSVLPYDRGDLIAHLRGTAAVLAAVSYRQNHIAELCARAAVPCVYVTEYTLRTRYDIVCAETINPILRARRGLWEYGQERRQARAIRNAAGVQCNGTPTHAAYRRINPRACLFFDTRCRAGDVIPLPALEARVAQLEARRPLRLLFSGRFLPWKGVQYLPRVAARLRELGVQFKLDLCGDGISTPGLRADIARLGLEDCVRLRGVLDFRLELTPLMQDGIDLFVCPHVQGDPSSTYAEAFAAGLPIAGFANEALAGMQQLAQAGVVTPMRDVGALARAVADLDRDRARLATAARRARAFALEHTFERTTQRRMDHVRECAAADRTVGTLGQAQ